MSWDSGVRSTSVQQLPGAHGAWLPRRRRSPWVRAKPPMTVVSLLISKTGDVSQTRQKPGDSRQCAPGEIFRSTEQWHSASSVHACRIMRRVQQEYIDPGNFRNERTEAVPITERGLVLHSQRRHSGLSSSCCTRLSPAMACYWRARRSPYDHELSGHRDCPRADLRVHLARRDVLSAQTYDDLNRQLVPVDIAAFRNLVDANETRYLREKLAPAAFRRIQRQRAIAALAYVKAVAHNAALLKAMADPARIQPESGNRLDRAGGGETGIATACSFVAVDFEIVGGNRASRAYPWWIIDRPPLSGCFVRVCKFPSSDPSREYRSARKS